MIKNRVKSVILEMLSECCESVEGSESWIDSYVEKLISIYNKPENTRFYLDGISVNNEKYFLISALSEEKAVEDANSYLKGNPKLKKIVISTLSDEDYCKIVVREGDNG